MTDPRFDNAIERKGTRCIKADDLQARFGRDDLLPLWVADMDFATPDFVRQAVMQSLEQQVWGYTMEWPRWRGAICDWQKRRHGWDVDPDWITFIPGIVKGIAMAVQLLSSPGDKIVIQPPVYHPFRLVPEGIGRKVVYNKLTEDANGRLTMNLAELDELTSDPEATMLILCNPHNPAGRIWDPDTLRQVAAICYRNGVTVISDEIHADMAMPGHTHTPFASVSNEAAAISITFGSPSKAFNMPGLASSYAIVPELTLRERFYTMLSAMELNDPAMCQQAPVAAAYDHGEEWLDSMLRYVRDNVEYINAFCRERLHGIKAVIPEASFLVWLDCRGLGLNHDQLTDLFVNKARLALNDGEMFGPGGEGHMRMNAGAPRATIRTALERLEKALK